MGVILKRKTRAGKTRYGVRIDRNGRQEWVGTFDKLSDARHAESQARNAQAPTRVTCDEFAAHWLEGYRERVKESSYDAAVSSLRKFTEDFRGIPLGKVTRFEAEKWARANRWRMPMVVTLMNAAVDLELIEKNRFAGMSRKGEGRRRNVPLSVDEVNELATTGKRLHGETFRSLILFLAYSGLRVGEAFALEWGDIRFNDRRIDVRRRVYKGRLDLPKSNKTREASLLPEARDALLRLDRSTEWVFQTKQGQRFSQPNMAWYWQGIQATFPRKITPHELRHFAAHHLYVTVGLRSRIVAAQLGHDGPELVEKLYGHGDHGALDELDRAFDKPTPLRAVKGA